MRFRIAAAFGGFTPAICTYLIHASGNRSAPGLWMSFGAVCGLAATLFLSAKQAGHTMVAASGQ